MTMRRVGGRTVLAPSLSKYQHRHFTQESNNNVLLTEICRRVQQAVFCQQSEDRYTSAAAATEKTIVVDSLRMLRDDCVRSRLRHGPQRTYSNIFPTLAENILVDCLCLLERMWEEGGDATPPKAHDDVCAMRDAVPSSMVVYHELMHLRYGWLTLESVDRTDVHRQLQEAWQREVTMVERGHAANVTALCTVPWETSCLAKVLNIPPRGHELLGHMLQDALTFLREDVGIKTCWMSGGTLLGAMRHGGFIPWDDDLDTCICQQDEETLRQFFETHRRIDPETGVAFVVGGRGGGRGGSSSMQREWILERCPLFGYKLYDRNTPAPIGEDALLRRGCMCFGAFVDIFIVENPMSVSSVAARLYLNQDQQQQQSQQQHLMRLHYSRARDTWPQETFDPTKTFPLVARPFQFRDGTATTTTSVLVSAPLDPADYMNRLYGPEWPSVAVIPQQLHYGLQLPSSLRIEQAVFLRK